VILLAASFTRPKPMKALAKLGFTQSCGYFTWRTQKAELEQYAAELTRYPERDFHRANFWTNTLDILPYHLQSGESWMFKSRLVLAATLSGNYGITSGFELLEHDAVAGKEAYAACEKYRIKVRDWDQADNIKPYIHALNVARRSNTALQQTANLHFVAVEDGNVIGFLKQSADLANTVAVAVALTREPHEFWFPIGDTQIAAGGGNRHVAAIENLMTGERHPVEWGGVRLRIDPKRDPALLFQCLA
jgi:starch synthase (maltosyl-transferring)